MISAVETKLIQIYRKHIQRRTIERGLFYTGGRANIGDSMVPWLINNVGGKEISYSNPREVNGPHLFTIGSILQYADANSYIWGSGFISEDSKVHSKPAKVNAVRGPLTAKRLKGLTNQDCDVFCDPALLTPRYIEPTIELGTTKIGLIPHYVDNDKLKASKIFNHNSVKLCDVETENIQQFINDICSCEVVISSSLHGIILAEAFGIPAVWAKFGNDVHGKDFKFYDYYLSTGRKRVEPKCFYTITELDLLNILQVKESTISSMDSSLLECFPNVFK